MQYFAYEDLCKENWSSKVLKPTLDKQINLHKVSAPNSICNILSTPQMKGIVDAKDMLNGSKKTKWRHNMTYVCTRQVHHK
jgi:hypothetical protein